MGLFEHDYHESYRTPWRKGGLPEPIYLMDHHRLIPDNHHEKGLLCVDCHEKEDVMDTGELLAKQQRAVKVRCEHCRGPKRPNVMGGPQLTDGPSRRSFQDRQGRWHPLPKWKDSVPAHSIKEMGRVHCISCHSAWGFYD